MGRLQEFRFGRSGAALRAREAKTSAQHQAARVSFEVAEVANRPKKRPGRRERSSITTRLQTMRLSQLLWYRAMALSNTWLF
jgi:hypothetical protein